MGVIHSMFVNCTVTDDYLPVAGMCNITVLDGFGLLVFS
jgi:hypothetical protein